MCISNPEPFYSDTPIIAYKVMFNFFGSTIVSMLSDDEYVLGQEYVADRPRTPRNIEFSPLYSVGFHAYEKIEDAMLCRKERRLAVVKVELSDITFKGVTIHTYFHPMPTFVANRCKFLQIVPRN